MPALPAGVRPVSVLGRSVVATAFVDYLPGGLLPYHELLVAPLVHRGRRLALSITDIWVDSPASLAGGRELWGIPKEPADFELTHGPTFVGTARTGGTLLAEASVRRTHTGARPPFPLRGSTLQDLRGALARTPLRATGRLHPARANWRFGERLSWLHAHRPVLSLATTDFTLRFGR